MSTTGKDEIPSMDLWLKEAKSDPRATSCGMYLFHNGVVRKTAKALARQSEAGTLPVTGLLFSYDAQKVSAAVALASRMEGIYYVRAWLNEGQLDVGRRHHAGSGRR